MDDWIRTMIFWRRWAWKILYKIGVTSKPNSISELNIRNLKYYFKSRHKDDKLVKENIACIMCTWGEEKMIPLALESSKDFVNRYIIVDKNGCTVPIIESYMDKWGIEGEIYVKPKMTLRESRAFALTHVDESWILIQDGDEVFHTDGPNAISTLRCFMNRPNIYFSTPMNVLCGDFLHTDPNIPQQPPHPFLYHNNGTIRAPGFNGDLPIMDGWMITLVKPYKFNCHIKSPRRMFLRQFWDEWCQETTAYIKFPNIEEYVSNKLGINIEFEVNEWYSRYLKTLIPYIEEKWGYYPKVIREQIKCTR